jgi:deoxyadenosine/deoxycytidine kinase
MSHTPIVYFVEGNIGTGKSTFLKMIEMCYPHTCQVIYEPVDTWTSFKDKDGVNILGHFYKDPKRYAYTFQNIAFISKIEKLTEIDYSKRFIFIERSIWSDKNVFAKNCHLSGLMNDIEYQVYNTWFKWIENNAEIPSKFTFMYLKCSPETSYKRVNIRGRAEESGLGLDYLTQIHDRHEEWLSPASLAWVVDAEVDYTDMKTFRCLMDSRVL